MDICLSITNYHPETWNPGLKIRQVVEGLTLFMLMRDHTAGAIYCTDDQC